MGSCYDFLSEYDLPDMSFASFDNLTERLATDQTTYNKINANQVGCYSNITAALEDTPQNRLSLAEPLLDSQQDLYCDAANDVDMAFYICTGQTNFSNLDNFADWWTAVLEGNWMTVGKNGPEKPN